MRIPGFRASLAPLAGLLLVGGPLPAAAAAVTYTWTGVVAFVDEALQAEGPTFAIDDPALFSVTIDDGVVGQPLSSGGATTYNPSDRFSLVLGDEFEFAGERFDAVGSITVQDSSTDAFRIDRQALPSATVPPDLGIFRPIQIIALLRDSSGTVFSSQALPTSLDLEDFDFTQLSLIYRDPDDFQTSAGVGISVSDVSVTVPEARRALLIGTLILAAFVAPRVPRRHGRGGQGAR